MRFSLSIIVRKLDIYKLIIAILYIFFYNFSLYALTDNVLLNNSETLLINGKLDASKNELSKVSSKTLKLSKLEIRKKIDDVEYFSNYIISNINSEFKLIDYRISDFDGDGEDDLFLIHGKEGDRINPFISKITFTFIKSMSKEISPIVREIDSNKIYKKDIAIFTGNLNKVMGNEIVVKLFDKYNDNNSTIAIFGNDFTTDNFTLLSLFNSQNGLNKKDDILDINHDKLFEFMKYKKLNFNGEVIYFPIIYTWFNGKIIPYPQGFPTFYSKISEKLRKITNQFIKNSKEKIESYYYLSISLKYEKKYNSSLKIMNMILLFLQDKRNKNFSLISRINREMKVIRKIMRKEKEIPTIY